VLSSQALCQADEHAELRVEPVTLRVLRAGVAHLLLGEQRFRFVEQLHGHGA
jgi:hypothetical protein